MGLPAAGTKAGAAGTAEGAAGAGAGDAGAVYRSRPFLNGHARLNGRFGKIARFSPVFL